MKAEKSQRRNQFYKLCGFKITINHKNVTFYENFRLKSIILKKFLFITYLFSKRQIIYCKGFDTLTSIHCGLVRLGAMGAMITLVCIFWSKYIIITDAFSFFIINNVQNP